MAHPGRACGCVSTANELVNPGFGYARVAVTRELFVGTRPGTLWARRWARIAKVTTPTFPALLDIGGRPGELVLVMAMCRSARDTSLG